MNQLIKLKNNKYYFVYFTFLFSFIILITCYCYINNVYNYTIKNKIQNRVLNITSYNNENDTNKTINNIPHIISVYHGYVNIVMYSNNNVKCIFNYYKYNVKSIEGELLTQLKNNEVIVPDSLNYKKNQKLITYLNEKKYVFNIVGIYDSKEVGSNDIFASETFMINNSLDSSKNNWNAIIDDYDNINLVIKKLQEKNYDVSIKDESGINGIKFYKLCLKIFTIGEVTLLIVILYILSLIIKDVINDSNYDIAILKTCGFHNSSILKIITKSLIITSLKIIFIIGMVILIIYYGLNIINKISYNFLPLSDIIKNITLSSIIFLVIILSVSFFNLKNIKKISPVTLFKIN